MTSAKSLATMLGLGLTISFGAATPALARVVPGCRNDQPQVSNKHCGHDTDGDGDVDDEDVVVADQGTPRRADTGFGGSAGTGSETTVLLVGGGLALLGAAYGVRRVRRAND